MLVHIERPSARARYVVSHVLERMLGLSVRYASGAEEFRSATGPRLSYGGELFTGAIHVPWSGAIKDLPGTEPLVRVDGEQRSIFLVGQEEDVFAGIFYLLCLWDELKCTQRDEHGRVPSSALFTARHGLADRPWVDEKVLALGRRIQSTWDGEVKGVSRYDHHVTVDMDNILRYAGRPLFRAIGATLKDAMRGDLSSVAERWRVRAGSHDDPYVKAVELLERHRESVHRATLFFLVHGQGAFDHASDPAHPATQRLVQRASRTCEIGIHPSYESSTGDHRSIEQERSALQRMIGRRVELTRQHFLRWRLPETLRQLDGSGFLEDHTLGFTDRAGFRAGTCTPFPWYDLEREQETRLMLHPFAVMDSALIEHQQLGPDGVVGTMNRMSDLVRAVGGRFITVWHDRYLSGHREFAPWPEVFTRVLEHARP